MQQCAERAKSYPITVANLLVTNTQLDHARARPETNASLVLTVHKAYAH